jgi:hypothetical protein
MYDKTPGGNTPSLIAAQARHLFPNKETCIFVKK